MAGRLWAGGRKPEGPSVLDRLRRAPRARDPLRIDQRSTQMARAAAIHLGACSCSRSYPFSMQWGLIMPPLVIASPSPCCNRRIEMNVQSFFMKKCFSKRRAFFGKPRVAALVLPQGCRQFGRLVTAAEFHGFAKALGKPGPGRSSRLDRVTHGRKPGRPKLSETNFVAALRRWRKVAAYFGVRFQAVLSCSCAVSCQYIRKTIVRARIWDSTHLPSFSISSCCLLSLMLSDWCLNAGRVGRRRSTPHPNASGNIHRAFNQTLHPTIWTANWSSWASPR